MLTLIEFIFNEFIFNEFNFDPNGMDFWDNPVDDEVWNDV